MVEKLSQQRRQNWRYLTGVLGITTLLMVTSGCGMVATGQNMTGVRLYEKGEYYAAMEEFQKAMTSNPDDADAYYNLAATLHRMGSASKDPNTLQQAETLYNECLNRNPDHVECYRGLAVLLAHTDRSDRAFVLLKNWAIAQSNECRRAGGIGETVPGVWRHEDGRIAAAAGDAAGSDQQTCMGGDCRVTRAERRLPAGVGQLSKGLHAERV